MNNYSLPLHAKNKQSMTTGANTAIWWDDAPSVLCEDSTKHPCTKWKTTEEENLAWLFEDFVFKCMTVQDFLWDYYPNHIK